jgi:uncharacterized membrane protein
MLRYYLQEDIIGIGSYLILALITQVQFNLIDSVNNTLKFLNDQSSILTLSSIVAAIGVFFYQQHNEKKKFNERIVIT